MSIDLTSEDGTAEVSIFTRITVQT